MSIFLRLLSDDDKHQALNTICGKVRRGGSDNRCFEVSPQAFNVVPGKPFSYWVSEAIRQMFVAHKTLITTSGEAWMGLSSGSDIQWLRLFWEVFPESILSHNHVTNRSTRWAYLSKGGEYAKYYPKIHVIVDWANDGEKLSDWKIAELEMGRITANNSKCWNRTKYFRQGLTWSRRTTSGISLRAMPTNCIFGDKGPGAFVANDNPEKLLELLAVFNSRPFSILVELQLAAADAAARSYEVGIIQKTPIPPSSPLQGEQLAKLARRAWSLKRNIDTVKETSHAFLLPAMLQARLGKYDPAGIEAELVQIQIEIDTIAFDLYGFTDADRNTSFGQGAEDEVADIVLEEDDKEDAEVEVPSVDALLSWAVGVAFGRFDWRLATGERTAPPEPEPFDPLPAKSPGMFPDGDKPFHAHHGILVDDQGHPHDLARLVEAVLERVSAEVPSNVRLWLQKEFFAFHLQRYSKSRRKAPIYWPIATASGSYTLWIYYPILTSQTLYTAINDFIEPKLKQVGADVIALRNKGTARSRDDEKQFETLQTFELELIELRDTLLALAPTYKPNQDDGVQISAAPLWSLFRHRPWQKLLKDTWAKLEKGDYDWAHLAMNYWPDRVREKCKTDKSLAIAHDLEELYVQPEAQPIKARAKKTKGTN